MLGCCPQSSAPFRAWLRCSSSPLYRSRSQGSLLQAPTLFLPGTGCWSWGGGRACHTSSVSLCAGSSLRAGGRSLLSFLYPAANQAGRPGLLDEIEEFSNQSLSCKGSRSSKAVLSEHSKIHPPCINHSRASPVAESVRARTHMPHLKAPHKWDLLPQKLGVGEERGVRSSYLQPPQRIRRVRVPVEKPSCLCPCA